MRPVAGPISWAVFLFLSLAPLCLGQPAADGEVQPKPDLKSPAPSLGVQELPPLTMSLRFREYISDTYGVGAVSISAVTAGFHQWRDFPAEWGQGMKGYGHRFASQMGRVVVRNSLEFGVEAALRSDARYYRSRDGSFWRRTGHAVYSTFVVRTAGGGRRIAVGRFSGAYGSGLIANYWSPESQNDVGDGIRRGSYYFGIHAATNVLREFWPDLRRIFSR